MLKPHAGSGSWTLGYFGGKYAAAAVQLAVPTHQRLKMTAGSQTSADGCPIEEGGELKVGGFEDLFRG